MIGRKEEREPFMSLDSAARSLVYKHFEGRSRRFSVECDNHGATRYDKLADNFLAMVKLASTRLWLRAYESTA
jgi:hypothetical protein